MLVTVALTLALTAAFGAALCYHTTEAQSPSAVTIGDNFFDPTTSTVSVGTTVTWTNGGGNQHTVTSDNGVFDSGMDRPQWLNTGQAFSFTFTEAGTYAYHCHLHGAPGGVGMSGTIVVEEAATAAPTAAPTVAPTAVPTASAAPVTLAPTVAASAAPSPTSRPSASPTPTPLFPPLSVIEAAPGTSNGGVSTAVWVLLAVGAAVIGLVTIGAVFYRRR